MAITATQSDPRPVVLVGYRGTGKSTVGPLLAARLGRAFVDADAELERRTQTTVAAIFAAEGEAGFRDREAELLAELLARPDIVLATGGGAVLRPENRERLKQEARFVAWLTAPAEIVALRLADDPATAARRPNLTPTGGLAEVRELLARREPLYREVASMAFPTGALPPEIVVAAIAAHLAPEAGSP